MPLSAPISVAEARRRLATLPLRLPTRRLSLPEALGCTLAAPVRADRDLPPFDRATMDGIFVSAAALAAGIRHFQCSGRAAAGQAPAEPIAGNACIEVATGAALAASGSGRLFPYETVQRDGAGGFRVSEAEATRATADRHVHLRGSDLRAGEIALPAGHTLHAGSAALCASAGLTSVEACGQARIAIVTTGDELVAPDVDPLSHQLRRSNDVLLAALFSPLPRVRIESAHLADDRAHFDSSLADLCARCDVVLTTGAVSMGPKDFFPEILASQGAECLFHGVLQRPGKPLWVGRARSGAAIFACPGNPASALVAAVVFALPWLRAQLGLDPERAEPVPLPAGIEALPDLTCWIPVSAERDSTFTLQPSATSGDLVPLARANAWLEVPPRSEARGEAQLWRWA